MQFHLDRQIDQNIKNGMNPKDARSAAWKEFNRVDQSKEECHEGLGVKVTSLHDSLTGDYREALQWAC